ncbi:MAG: metallophosphoesterase [Pseudomonadota bacterium]
MKCLHVADLHYNLRKFDWVVDAAGDVDLVILAGDHLEISMYLDRPAQSVVVRKYFKRIRERAPLLISSGNHDLDVRDTAGERICRWIGKARALDVPTDGDSPVIGDTLFSLCPWWDGDRVKHEMIRQIEQDALKQPKRWIWVHHAPPQDSPTSWTGKRFFGDQELRALIERFQPDAVLSGHVHQSPYIDGGSWADRIGRTWIFNAGHQLGPVPSHVLIDTEDGTAYWKCLGRGETVQLDAPLERPIPQMSDAPDWMRFMDRLLDQDPL